MEESLVIATVHYVVDNCIQNTMFLDCSLWKRIWEKLQSALPRPNKFTAGFKGQIDQERLQTLALAKFLLSPDFEGKLHNASLQM